MDKLSNHCKEIILQIIGEYLMMEGTSQDLLITGKLLLKASRM